MEGVPQWVPGRFLEALTPVSASYARGASLFAAASATGDVAMFLAVANSQRAGCPPTPV